MNPSGTMAQFNFGTNNGTTVALAGGQTSVLSPRNVMGTEALLSMRGWLLKRKRGVYDPSKGKSITKMLGGDFNKRFFWIDSSIRLIYYSESEDNSKRVSFIPFSRVMSAAQVTDPMAINTARPGWVYGIELRTTDRVYELWARTPSEARQWLDVMDKAASIGRSAGISSTSYALAAVGTTTHYLDSLGPLNGTSRRGSTNSGSSGAAPEQGNTIPVVNGPQVPQASGDDITVVAALKENLDRTANAVDMVRSPVPKDPHHAPSKWDDWDR